MKYCQGWITVAVLSIAYIFSYMDRQLLALLLEPIRQDMNLSDTKISMLTGLAFAASYSICVLPFGRLTDSFNRRNIIAAGVSVWSLMTGLCGLAQNFTHLFFARLGVGIGEAALPTAAYSMIADYFPPHKLALAMSVFVVGAPLGAGLAMIAGGSVVDWIHHLPQMHLGQFIVKPWQATFMSIGGLGFIVSLLVLILVEPPRNLFISMETNETAPSFSVRDVFHFLQTRMVFLALLIGGLSLINIVNYGLLAWLATFFIRIHGWSLLQTGTSIGMPLLIFGSFGVLAGGWLVNSLTGRGYHDACLRAILCAIPIMIASCLVVFLIRSPHIAVIFIAPLMFSLFFMAGIFPTLIQIITPNRMRGQVSAVYLLIVNLAGLGLGPTAFAITTDYIFGSPQALNYSLASVSFVLLTIGAALIRLAMPYYRLEVINSML
jgi:MFS family permease